MGKIYDYSDIANHNIPCPKDFALTKQLILEGLSAQVEKGEVLGAKVFGSVALGKPSVRSDFDLVVILEDEKANAGLIDCVERVHEKTHVEIEPVAISKSFAEQGLHNIDRLYYGHIISVPSDGNEVGQPIVSILKPLSTPIVEVHKQYLTQKVRRFRSGLFTHSESQKNQTLQRALEAPANIGRRMLQTLSWMGLITTQVDVDDSKSIVYSEYRRIFGNSDTFQRGFDFLVLKDAEYVNVLRDAMQGKTTQQEYEAYIKDTYQECIPQAIAWTSELLSLHSGLIEGNTVSKEDASARRCGKEQLL